MLEPHQIQPGSLDEDRAPLWLVPDEGGDTVRVIDRIQANAGAYLIVMNEAGVHSLLPEGTVLGDYSAREPEAAPDPEAARLQAENDELRARLADGDPQAAADLGHDPTPADPAATPAYPPADPAAPPAEPTPGV